MLRPISEFDDEAENFLFTRNDRNEGKPRRHDAKHVWAKTLVKEWKISDAVNFSIKQLFNIPTHLPSDPFKTVIFSLRRKEYIQGK